MTQPSSAVARASAAVAARPQTKGIKEYIQENLAQLQTSLPSHMNAERMQRIALTTVRLNPKLMECTPASFLGALFQSAQLGLEPNINGESWIIPYENRKKNCIEAQFQVGAYGWVKLFYNHKDSGTIQMAAVHEHDTYVEDVATSQIHHSKPAFGQDRGKVIGYYAIITMANGFKVACSMSYQETFEHAKRYSKSWDREKNEFRHGTPWRENFNSMGPLPSLKQAMKLVPKSVEIQRALAMDQTTKTRIDPDMLNIPDETEWTEAEVVESEKLPAVETKEEAKVKQPPKPEVTGDPVKDKSARERVTLEAVIRTLKVISSVEKVMEQITEKANAGDLTEDDKHALVEKLEAKQAELLEAEKKPAETKPASQPTGFDPHTEINQTGKWKDKNKTWIEADMSWLVYIRDNTQSQQLKMKSEATIAAKEADNA